MNIFRRAYIRYILHRYAINHELWLETERRIAILHGLSSVEKVHLRELGTLFLHEKNFVGVQGLELDEFMRLSIAVQACLPVLKLGIKLLEGWIDVIVYPGPFRVHRDAVDSSGVVHHQEQILSGESWSRGPIILSWADVEQDIAAPNSGRNVVIHEIAHKLDALNGTCNGFPPLHTNMSITQWTTILTTAYRSLISELERGHCPAIDPYAANSPAEFFAVISEYFFSAPETLQSHYADVYRQLLVYYRQNPLLRL